MAEKKGNKECRYTGQSWKGHDKSEIKGPVAGSAHKNSELIHKSAKITKPSAAG